MDIQKLEHFGQLQKKICCLLDLVVDAMAQIEGKHLDRVCWDISLSPHTQLLVEPALFQCVLRNLLKNEAKYAIDGSTVCVMFDPINECGKLIFPNMTVHGLDLPLARLGERFFRHAAFQDIEGSGLGLSIVAKIVELHQMDLSYEFTENHEFRAVLTVLG